MLLELLGFHRCKNAPLSSKGGRRWWSYRSYEMVKETPFPAIQTPFGRDA